MGRIIDIRDKLVSREVFEIYSACMYIPTWEKYCERANEFISDSLVSILGFSDENNIIGVIVIKQEETLKAEIKGIAVNPLYRKQGIAKQLVWHAFENLQLSALFAETDNDAIGFYRNCGFQIDSFVKQFDDGDFQRYKCVLQKL